MPTSISDGPHEDAPAGKVKFDCPELYSAVDQAIQKAVIFRRDASNSAEPADDPFEVLKFILSLSFVEVERVRTHACSYDGDDRCTECGEDGRA